MQSLLQVHENFCARIRAFWHRCNVHNLVLRLLRMPLLNNNFKFSILETFNTQWSVSEQASSQEIWGKEIYVHGNEN